MYWHHQIQEAAPRWDNNDGEDELHPWAGNLYEFVYSSYKSVGYRALALREGIALQLNFDDDQRKQGH